MKLGVGCYMELDLTCPVCGKREEEEPSEFVIRYLEMQQARSEFRSDERTKWETCPKCFKKQEGDSQRWRKKVVEFLKSLDYICPFCGGQTLFGVKYSGNGDIQDTFLICCQQKGTKKESPQ